MTHKACSAWSGQRNMTRIPIYRLRKAGGGAVIEEAVASSSPMYRLASALNEGPSIAALMDEEILKARKCCACAKVEDASQGAGKLLVCQRCRTAYYCSKECQRADWKGHKAALQGRLATERPSAGAC